MLIDLTSRGMKSEMNNRWRSEVSPSRSPDPEAQEAQERLAAGDFFPSRHWTGVRDGYMFTKGVAGQGYYRDGRCKVGGSGAGALLQQVLVQLQVEEEQKRGRKKDKKDKKDKKKKRKREEKAAKKLAKKTDGRRKRRSSSSDSSS